jgi:hypothetical protein
MNFGGFVNFLRNEELQVVHSALTKFHLPDSQGRGLDDRSNDGS